MIGPSLIDLSGARDRAWVAARVRILMGSLVVALGCAAAASAAQSATLELEATIPLGSVRGRIDHLAVDLNHQRLFVAELGNDSVGVVDLKTLKVIRNLTGFKEPQGVAYVPSTDTLYVANADNGSVHLFQGADLTPAGRIALGDDADNVRVDDTGHRVFVGYGSGALAAIDTIRQTRLPDVPLKAHPESFQMSRSGQQIFVNIPDAHEIAVIDRATNRQTHSWALENLAGNFPMAIDEARQQVFVVFRHPAKLGVFNTQNGAVLGTYDTCGDADDVFVDPKRARVYISCGEGFLDVWTAQSQTFSNTDRITTEAGARTALFVADLDRLFLAVRGTVRAPAAIWVFRPAP